MTQPLFCSLGAPEFRERRAEIQVLLDHAASAKAVPDGVAFAFPASSETAHTMVDFILFEKDCCSSVTYELRSEPDHSTLVLRLTAGAAQVEALQAMYLKSGILKSTWPSGIVPSI